MFSKTFSNCVLPQFCAHFWNLNASKKFCWIIFLFYLGNNLKNRILFLKYKWYEFSNRTFWKIITIIFPIKKKINNHRSLLTTDIGYFKKIQYNKPQTKIVHGKHNIQLFVYSITFLCYFKNCISSKLMFKLIKAHWSAGIQIFQRHTGCNNVLRECSI